MSAAISYQTRTKTAAEVVVFVFDFSNFPEIVAGETISSTTVPAVSGITIGTPAVLTEETDGVPEGEGVAVTISAGTVGTDYTVDCRIVTSGGSTRAVRGVVAVR